MKRMSEILAHLFHPSAETKIERHRCYRKFLDSLPSKWENAVAFIYIRESTLFVAMRHPGYKMELHYNRDLLKSLLTNFARTHPNCRIPSIENVVVFNSKFQVPYRHTEATVPRYAERAKGDFAIPVKDAELFQRFQSIRGRINRA
jgi:hypothetical protein